MKILLSILLVTSFLSANDFEKGFSKLSTEQMAEVLAQMIGKQLPRRLDEITVAKETFFDGKIYGMKKYLIPENKQVAKDFKPYLVSKLYEKQSFYEFMKRSEVSNMCKSNLIRMFLNNKGQVKVDYYNQEEENILFILLNKKDCK
ncbi:hypothetical protein [Poseidonibacter ostreae]|jgi:hypothetical protein|uniref:Uncharacterized protein n=1 Tax=Poseidonibacter ostreae TaxID=2654171 RepID=A0A6L4WUG2_9BACT|nr:hypothetical protein [Poseidonibacter ostreae]KAB7884688.1 hypothetical protein GA417_10780 [Poseidonibacter ostreae]KAB7889963.1 hypothetical protein GBG19_04325 [Poseidonibacter ostreae]KAB7891477.1 hypothetical protein GBG18_06885 [Poseidonibacter ostreae]MAC83104.1 hypothetical protein [Arcobacter sp.]|tara:strand:+ start:1758 stop:2195 length:438 start_codon:yes stop_codon:yes gene_type:complete